MTIAMFLLVNKKEYMYLSFEPLYDLTANIKYTFFYKENFWRKWDSKT